MRVREDIAVEREVWRDGVETLLLASAATGAAQLTVFEQWCTPGHGAPLHSHVVEEVLRILAGRAQVVVSEDECACSAGSTIIVPAGAVHGFTNVGDEPLHVLAILAEPIFEAHYVAGARDVRRWSPGSTAAATAR